jgi:hypothetical protein
MVFNSIVFDSVVFDSMVFNSMVFNPNAWRDGMARSALWSTSVRVQLGSLLNSFGRKWTFHSYWRCDMEKEN